LVLPLGGPESEAQVFSEEFNRDALVGLLIGESKPHQMYVIIRTYAGHSRE